MGDLWQRERDASERAWRARQDVSIDAAEVCEKAEHGLDPLTVDTHGPCGLRLPPEQPLNGNGAPEPVGRREAQLTMPSHLNGEAYTMFGGNDDVLTAIIAKSVLELWRRKAGSPGRGQTAVSYRPLSTEKAF